MIIDLPFIERFLLWFVDLTVTGLVIFVCILIAREQRTKRILEKLYSKEDKEAEAVMNWKHNEDKKAQ